MEDLEVLIAKYQRESGDTDADLASFSKWVSNTNKKETADPTWRNKAKGRSPESVINTALAHLYRYAKLYAKAAIAGTAFSTPDDFIYLLNLVTNGNMTKSALIRLNVHEKSPGMQIVNRLINNGLVNQHAMENNKKSQMISITPFGERLVEETIYNIRTASKSVAEPLSHQEKLDLIRLLMKLEDFHDTKMQKNLSPVIR